MGLSTLDDYVFRIAFSHNLRLIMMDNNWDARTLSKLSGITESNISRYLNGERLPSIQTVHILLKVLGCKYEDLFEI